MIVVAIMGIVMTMSVPIVYKVWRKAPMRKAVSDVVEVCSHARARAIMQGTMTEVVFHPKENRLEVAGAGGPPRSAGEAGRGTRIQRSGSLRFRPVGATLGPGHHRNAGYQHVGHGVQ